MTQATDTDIAQLKDLMLGMREEMRVGFANFDTKLADIRGEIREVKGEVKQVETKLEAKIDQLDTKLEGKIDKLDGKVTTLTTNVSNLDGRLWAFGLTLLAALLGALLTIFGRYIFTGLPIV